LVGPTKMNDLDLTFA